MSTRAIRGRRSGATGGRPLGQRGFTLIEVMFASLILSGIAVVTLGFYSAQAASAFDLTLRQQAIFVLNGETERISALYTYTNFGVAGPETTTGYTEVSGLPTTRLIYPSNLQTWLGNGPDAVQTSLGAFSGKLFSVYFAGGGTASLDRNYVWLDQQRSVVARISWTVTDITVSSCTDGGDCKCTDFSGSGAGLCKKLDVFLDYPYRVNGGVLTAPAKLETITLRTIVGRGE